MRFLFLLCALYAGTVGAQSTAIYVSAHQDDWQLFMNPNAYYSIQNPDTKTIILHTTAGDAGVGKKEVLLLPNSLPRSIPPGTVYWTK